MRRATILAVVIVGLTPPAFAQEACPAPSRDESIAIARQFHDEVINRRNPAVLDTILADSIRHHAAGGYPDEMDAAGVKAMMGDFLDAFPDLAFSFDLWAVDGDLVVERYTATGTQEGPLGDLAPTGRKASWTGVNIFRIDCGRIVELWSEVDAVSRNRQLTE
jgi:predicted ester cyclase